MTFTLDLRRRIFRDQLQSRVEQVIRRVCELLLARGAFVQECGRVRDAERE